MSRLVKVPEAKRMLSDLRVLAGLTQPETAKTVGIPTYTYALVERGLREPDSPLVERLAAAFSVSGAEIETAWRRTKARPSGAPA